MNHWSPSIPPENIRKPEGFRGYRKRLIACNGLTLSWRRSLSYRNQSIDLLSIWYGPLWLKSQGVGEKSVKEQLVFWETFVSNLRQICKETTQGSCEICFIFVLLLVFILGRKYFNICLYRLIFTLFTLLFMYLHPSKVILVFQLAKWILLFSGVGPTRWVMRSGI